MGIVHLKWVLCVPVWFVEARDSTANHLCYCESQERLSFPACSNERKTETHYIARRQV